MRITAQLVGVYEMSLKDEPVIRLDQRKLYTLYYPMTDSAEDTPNSHTHFVSMVTQHGDLRA